MTKKLQVFVSSTYKDLINERQKAVEGILKARHIPAGMELFVPTDKTQWEIIKEWIKDSDVLFLIYNCMKKLPYPLTPRVNGYGFRIFI